MKSVTVGVAAALVALVGGGCGPGGTGLAGRHWTALPLNFDTRVHDVFFLDESHGWIVGGERAVKGGLIAVTHDGGATWEVETNVVKNLLHPERFSLRAVRFVNPEHGWVGGDGGVILRTVDGGKNWETQRKGDAPDHVEDLDFLDSDIGWAATRDGVLWTTDGGESWSNGHLPPVSRACYAIQFLDARIGFVAGEGGILGTSDGGRSWEATAAPDLDFLGIDFPTPLDGWAVGTSGAIVHTRDGGATWEVQDNGLVKGYPLFWDVKFADERQGWVVGYVPRWDKSMILSTENGGQTWRLEQEVLGQELQALDLIDARHAWAAGDRVAREPLMLLRLTR